MSGPFCADCQHPITRHNSRGCQAHRCGCQAAPATECSHGVPLDWNCNGCSDARGPQEATAQAFTREQFAHAMQVAAEYGAEAGYLTLADYAGVKR